jgi:allantoate deiminase
MEEEGSRFGSAFIGSKWLIGDIREEDLDDYIDAEGKTVASECGALDALNTKVDRCKRKEFSPQMTFELHIEQGPVLESKGNILGVVDTITGSSAYQVVIEGEANHAGTIPMNMRKDAFVAVSQISLELNRIAKAQPIHTVGTIGFLEIKPNAYNIIPGRVDFSMDIRSLDQACMEGVTLHMKDYIEKVCGGSGLEFSIRTKHNQPVVALAPDLVGALKASAEERNYGHVLMGSGAGHDTLVMARIAPSAMVFVPSRDGRSHCPEEYTNAEEIAKGADLILDAVIRLG